jgi:hypothetical protein
LYFACKNYEELAQARITKVVGYFTTNPKKLVSNFSDFSTMFYAIYKKQGNHFTIGVTLLLGSPRKESFFCNVAPGRPAGAGCLSPASSPPGLAREGREEGLGVP